jgi:hypothetical protein
MTTTETQMCWSGGEPTSSDPAGDTMMQDVIAASSSGIDLEQYFAARNSELTHDQAVELCGWKWRGSPLKLTLRAMQAGIDFDQVRAVQEIHPSIPPQREPSPAKRVRVYTEARKKGVTHAEFVLYDRLVGKTNSPDWLVDLVAMVDTRQRGVNHDSLAQYLAAGGWKVGEYNSALDAGITHEEILAVMGENWYALESYTTARRNGKSHDEGLQEAADRGK